MRITFDANACGYSGFAFADELRKRGVESEFSDFRYTVLLFSTAQDFNDFEQVWAAAEKIKALPPIRGEKTLIVRAESVLSPREAVFSETEAVPVEKALGRICADINTACPPCVPIVMAGERISDEGAEMLRRYGVGRVRVVK